MNLSLWTWPNDGGIGERPVSLVHDDVHVWIATLPVDQRGYDLLTGSLDPAERSRADRYHYQSDRQQFVFARGLLRTLLGSYLGLPASQVKFEYQPGGKPVVPSSASDRGLHFNLSHSTDLILLAFSRRYPVGVDVEQEDRLVDWRGVARRILSPREKTEFDALPQACQPRAFYHVWTRKEAVLKATGDGLLDRMAEIEVTVSPDLLPRLISFCGQPADASSWSMHNLALGTKHVGTLAVRLGNPA
jgi:4'-phosphopantetheinyl transferase